MSRDTIKTIRSDTLSDENSASKNSPNGHRSYKELLIHKGWHDLNISFKNVREGWINWRK